MPLHIKGAAVQHDVTHNDFHAHALQTAQHQPQALRHQLGVARALDIDRAPESTVVDHPIQIQRCAPHIGGAQLLQRGIGGHQLHDRSRVHGRLRLPGQARWLR